MAKKNAERTMRPWSEYLEDLGNMVRSLFNILSAASFHIVKRTPTQSDSLLSPCTRIRLASGLILLREKSLNSVIYMYLAEFGRNLRTTCS